MRRVGDPQPPNWPKCRASWLWTVSQRPLVGSQRSQARQAQQTLRAELGGPAG